MFRNKLLVLAAIACTMATTAGVFASDHKSKKQVTFTVRVENVANKDGLTAQDGSRYPFALSPGAYAISEKGVELFKKGKKATAAIEAQAEDGNAEPLAKWLGAQVAPDVFGIFNRPVGSTMPGPIVPGGSYEFSFKASAGMKLTLAAMFGQSNDLFYAPESPIALFDADGTPFSGDVTERFLLWDAGTEVNQAPGIGSDQAPRQSAKNTGAAENGVVKLVNDGFTYPATKDVLQITITAQ